jgi:hypothetical protein
MVNPAFKNALYASRRTGLTRRKKLVTVRVPSGRKRIQGESGFTEQAMTKVLALLIGFALAGAAQAQIKCWTGTNGKRACGDLPPPGVRLITPKGAPAPQDRAPVTTDTQKAAPASTPQDQQNRTRQAKSQKAATKADLERASGSMQECERAREMLREMGGGGRSKRTDAVKARALFQNNCPS